MQHTIEDGVFRLAKANCMLKSYLTITWRRLIKE